nr:MAG TPA: RuvA, C-terminal domain [Caudoviricetes sp.]
MKMERKSIGGLTDSALEMLGYDKEKILKAVENCVIAMGELTIEESKVARKHLNSVMEEMYKRNPDTLISAIQPRL